MSRSSGISASALNHTTPPTTKPISMAIQFGVWATRFCTIPVGNAPAGLAGSKESGNTGAGAVQPQVAASSGRSSSIRNQSSAVFAGHSRCMNLFGAFFASHSRVAGAMRISGTTKPRSSRAQAKGTPGEMSLRSASR